MAFCFLDAVRKSLLIDYNEDISIIKMIEMVMYELYEQLHSLFSLPPRVKSTVH